MKLSLLRICACALAVTGCVSLPSLEQDLKSSDVQKSAEAKKNLVKIITTGKVHFSTFDSSDRLWCAKQITDVADVVKVIEHMSHRYATKPQDPPEVKVAHEGIANEENALVLEELLKKVKDNKDVAAIFMRGDIECEANPHHRMQRGRTNEGPSSKVYSVILKYMESYIGSLTDLKELCGLYRSSTKTTFSYELREAIKKNALPKRIIEITSTVDDVKDFMNFFKNIGWSHPEEVTKAVLAKIKDQRDLLKLYRFVSGSDKGLVFGFITDQTILHELAMNETSEDEYGWNTGVEAVKKISDTNTLINIALLAKSSVVSKVARGRITDKKSFIDGMAELLAKNKIAENKIAEQVDALEDGEATVLLYNSAKSQTLKQKIIQKLSTENRKIVRANNVKKCKELIEAAKSKKSDTFELGGFYLGMNIKDVDILIGYYFPDWSTSETVDSDKKDIRVVYVPQQRRPFCRAGKDGKVWNFNFGKNILRKFYKYDVQNEKEWANAYSRQHGIDLKYVYLNKDTTVNVPQADLSVKQYKAWLHQDTWQWKNNAKGYRLTYFAEPKVETAWGDVIEDQASYQFRFISCEAGTLRVVEEID